MPEPLFQRLVIVGLGLIGSSLARVALKARGVIVRPMGSYALGQCIRITVGTDEECALVEDVLVAEFADA